MHNTHMNIHPKLQSTTTYNLESGLRRPRNHPSAPCSPRESEQPKRCQFRSYETTYWTLILLQKWTQEDASAVEVRPLCMLTTPLHRHFSLPRIRIEALRRRSSMFRATWPAQTHAALSFKHVGDLKAAELSSVSPRQRSRVRV